VGTYKPHKNAPFRNFYLSKQESMIVEQHLDWEELHLNFLSIHSCTVRVASRLVLSVTSSVGHRKRFEFGMTSCGNARKIKLDTE